MEERSWTDIQRIVVAQFLRDYELFRFSLILSAIGLVFSYTLGLLPDPMGLDCYLQFLELAAYPRGDAVNIAVCVVRCLCILFLSRGGDGTPPH